MAGEDYTSPINGKTYRVPKYEEPADAPVAFKDFADNLPPGGIDFDPDRVGQVVQSLDGAAWDKGMALQVVDAVPDDTAGEIGDVVFIPGGPGGSTPGGPASGLVHLHTETFSAASSVSIDDVFSSTYQNYLMIIENTNSQGAELQFQWRVSGSPITSGYRTAWSITTDSAAVDDTTFASTSRTTGFINYLLHANTLMYSSCSIVKPFESTFSPVISTIVAYGPSNALNQGSSATVNESAASYDGINVQIQAGTMTGTIRIYGYSEGGN